MPGQVLILVPTAIFYVVVYGSGHTLEEARESGWLFPTAEQNRFWSQFEELYGGVGRDAVH